MPIARSSTSVVGFRATAVGMAALVAVAHAPAQCVGGGEWVPLPAAAGNGPGAIGLAVQVWDPDGPGPLSDRLFVGTTSIPINPEGEPLAFIAQWDGEDASPWRPVGGGMSNGRVQSLTVAGDNSLIAGGNFTHAGGGAVEARCLARWDGTQWHAMGDATYAGPVQPGAAEVYALATLTTGDVVAGGWFFDTVGGVAVQGVARWDGAGWHAMGSGLSGPLSQYGYQPNIYDMRTLSDGRLAVVGGFTNSGGGPIEEFALWDGLGWSGPTAGPPVFQSRAFAVGELADGRIVVGGCVFPGEKQAAVNVWNGAGWDPLGNMDGGCVASFLLLPDGNFVAGAMSGGNFAVDGHDIGPLARWDGASWSRMMPPGSGGRIYDMTMYRGDLIVVGEMNIVADDGSPQFSSVARWRPGPCTPSCRADINGMGGVTVQDIYDFLAAWNAGLTTADFNGAGGVTVQDIYDFLAAWNAGCP